MVLLWLFLVVKGKISFCLRCQIVRSCCLVLPIKTIIPNGNDSRETINIIFKRFGKNDIRCHQMKMVKTMRLCIHGKVFELSQLYELNLYFVHNSLNKTRNTIHLGHGVNPTHQNGSVNGRTQIWLIKTTSMIFLLFACMKQNLGRKVSPCYIVYVPQLFHLKL